MRRAEQYLESGVRSLCCVGRRLWVGLACGGLRVVCAERAEPTLLAAWHAHDAAVISVVQLGARMYTLGRDGSIKGWSASVPHASDSDCR